MEALLLDLLDIKYKKGGSKLANGNDRHHEVCEYHLELSDLLTNTRSDIRWAGRIVKALITIMTALLVATLVQLVGLFGMISDMNVLSKSNSLHITKIYEHLQEHDKILERLQDQIIKLNERKR